MLSNIVASLTVLCFIEASVVVNIFDDDVDTRHSLDAQRCNLRWCEQQCHRMGFPGGVCVGDRCKCDIISQSTDVDTRHSLDVQSCNLRWCEQQCRRMGFPGGVCVDDRCKCDSRELIDLSALQSLDVQDCNIRWCEQQCRRMGFPGGVCVGDRCKCDIIKDTTEPPVGRCDEKWCNVDCRKRGYRVGVCIGDKCDCYGIKSENITNNEIPTGESNEEENKIEAEETSPTSNIIETAAANSHTLGKCSPIHCFHSCRRKGMHGGVCSPMLTCICY